MHNLLLDCYATKLGLRSFMLFAGYEWNANVGCLEKRNSKESDAE